MNLKRYRSYKEIVLIIFFLCSDSTFSLLRSAIFDIPFLIWKQQKFSHTILHTVNKCATSWENYRPIDGDQALKYGITWNIKVRFFKKNANYLQYVILSTRISEYVYVCSCYVVETLTILSEKSQAQKYQQKENSSTDR